MQPQVEASGNVSAVICLQSLGGIISNNDRQYGFFCLKPNLSWKYEAREAQTIKQVTLTDIINDNDVCWSFYALTFKSCLAD